jgi:hypothetical protein
VGAGFLIAQQHAKLGVDEGADAGSCFSVGRAGLAGYGIGGPADVVRLPDDFQVEVREQPRRDEQSGERDTARVLIADSQLTLTLFVDEVGAIQAAGRGQQAAAEFVVPVIAATLAAAPDFAGQAEPEPARPVQKGNQIADSALGRPHDHRPPDRSTKRRAQERPDYGSSRVR